MAIKALELRREIDAKRGELAKLEQRMSGFVTRAAELEQKIQAADDGSREEVEAEVEALEAEKAEAETEAGTLRGTIEDLENQLAEEEAKEPSAAKDQKQRGIKTMATIEEIRSSKEYVNAFARYIKTGKDEEVRSLLTENVSGGVPVPTIVDGVVKTAWDDEQIMSRVRKTYLKGNVKVGFEISATGAVVHTEGTDAPDEEVLTLGIVTMVPANIKKWITVSDEALELSGEEFLNYIYKELTHMIAKKCADLLVAAIVASAGSSTATKAGQDAITAGIAQSTIITAMGHLSDEASNPVIIMNRGSQAEFKAAQYAGNFNTDIFENLEVLFNNTLPAYSAADAADVYAIVGDLGHGAQANLPNGDVIKLTYDELSLAEKDLVKIVGREFVGLGVVAPKAFCLIKKPSTT